MSKKSRLSRNQKRQQKLARREVRQPNGRAMAYSGNRYKTPQLVKPLFRTEGSIYEAYVISRRELTDQSVENALCELIGGLETAAAADLIYADEDTLDPRRDFVTSRILSNWEYMLEEGQLPARDNLIGILRTILGSIETWRSKSASSRAYLNYLEGFMKKMGVMVELADSAGEVLPGPAPDELYEVGEIWLAGSPEARGRFTSLANELLEKAQAERVLNACQKLLGMIGTPTRPEFPILSELSIRAQAAANKMAAPDFAPGLKRFVNRLAGW